MLRDPKVRSNHKLLLSREDLEIVEPNCAGREPDESLFPTVDARKTLAWPTPVPARTTHVDFDLRSDPLRANRVIE